MQIGSSFHLHHYLLKRHYRTKERRTVGKQVGRPVRGMTDMTCHSSGHLRDDILGSSLCLSFVNL